MNIQIWNCYDQTDKKGINIPVLVEEDDRLETVEKNALRTASMFSNKEWTKTKLATKIEEKSSQYNNMIEFVNRIFS